jgi:hypothetical protein
MSPRSREHSTFAAPPRIEAPAMALAVGPSRWLKSNLAF